MRRVFLLFFWVVLLWAGPASALDPFNSAGASLGEGCPDDTWCEQPVAPGVLWRIKKYSDLFGGRQTANVLEVGMKTPGVSVKPVMQAESGTCQKSSRIGIDSGAVAGVNGGYFDTGACVPLGFRKIDKDVVAEAVSTRPARSAIGITAVGGTLIRPVGYGDHFDEVTHGLGGGPRLVKDGASAVSSAMAAEEIAASMNDKHPRTALGLKGDTLVAVTFDGRTSAGAGVTLDELAQWFSWYGVPDAMNLDGGGSTTMWVAGEPDNGVVNYPSDNGKADHLGERSVTDGLFVFYKVEFDAGRPDAGGDAGPADAETGDGGPVTEDSGQDSSEPPDASGSSDSFATSDVSGLSDAFADTGVDEDGHDAGSDVPGTRDGSPGVCPETYGEFHCTPETEGLSCYLDVICCGKVSFTTYCYCEGDWRGWCNPAPGRCMPCDAGTDGADQGGLELDASVADEDPSSVAPAGGEGGCSCAFVMIAEPDDTMQVVAAALTAAALFLLLAIRRKR